MAILAGWILWLFGFHLIHLPESIEGDRGSAALDSEHSAKTERLRMGTPEGASEDDDGKCDHRRLVANHMGPRRGSRQHQTHRCSDGRGDARLDGF